MPRLAFYTFGNTTAPFGTGVMEGFRAALPVVFGAAEGSDGFIAHAHTAKPEPTRSSFGQVFGPWGAFVLPRSYDGGEAPGTVSQASTLSLWRGIDAVRRFAYGGAHRDALDRRGEWCRRPGWPGYVTWWVADDHTPTWAEACRKLEMLHDHGPTPSAFGFGTPFDPEGRPLRSTASVAASAAEGA
jgi:hypothetical protein